MCSNISGIVGSGATVTLSCAGGSGTPGRFLIVQIPGKLGILTLCEVQVFGNGRIAFGVSFSFRYQHAVIIM